MKCLRAGADVRGVRPDDVLAASACCDELIWTPSPLAVPRTGCSRLPGAGSRPGGGRTAAPHEGHVQARSALRWSPAGPSVFAAQLDRVAMVAAHENVSVASSGTVRPVLPRYGFTLYADRGDDPFVSVELAHTYMTLNHPTDVAVRQQHNPPLVRLPGRHLRCFIVSFLDSGSSPEEPR